MLGVMFSVLMASLGGTTDYAAVEHLDAWLRHPVYGDASFDSFEHATGNPVHRGSPPYKWPVNGFLFCDPVSSHWFLYAGEYLDGYAFEEQWPSRCIVFRSPDEGQHWEKLGPVFADVPYTFEGESSPVSHAPDVSVAYADGRYHLCFDWTTKNTTWANAANPPPDANSGVGYAWADSPEGPFQITPKPLATTRAQVPLLGKYRRLYASTLVRRANDWLVLTLTDSGPNFGWALLGMTAAAPEGPYTPLQLLLHPELPRFHPPLLEFFPAFAHDDYVYAPATSVALNRNYQAILRAPLEKAHTAGAWELYQHGSVWHAEPVEHETHGIWGQTFSGFINSTGAFHVMFPSRDAGGNGTLNLAQRPWDKPYRPTGFLVSGHRGPSLALLKRSGPFISIEAELELRGTATLIFDYGAPLGPDRPASDSSLHPLMLTRSAGLELTRDHWALVQADEAGAQNATAEGVLTSPPSTLHLNWLDDQHASLDINGARQWEGELPPGAGLFALLVGKESHVRMARLALTHDPGPAHVFYLYTEALVCAAQNLKHWEIQEDPRFRFGVGVVSKEDGVLAKWNIEASAFTLHAPRDPDYGTATLEVDGQPVQLLDFSAPETAPSSALYSQSLSPGRHAVALRPTVGSIPLDCLEATLE